MEEENPEIVFISKEQDLWQKIVDARKGSIKNLKDSLIIEEVFLKAAEEELNKAKAL